MTSTEHQLATPDPQVEIPRKPVLDAWQSWRLGEGGPFWVVIYNDNVGSIQKSPDRATRIRGMDLIAADPMDICDLNPENATMIYNWRANIELVETVTPGWMEDSEGPFYIDWTQQGAWAIHVGIGETESGDVEHWIQDIADGGPYPTLEWARHAASNITNPTRVVRVE